MVAAHMLNLTFSGAVNNPMLLRGCHCSNCWDQDQGLVVFNNALDSILTQSDTRLVCRTSCNDDYAVAMEFAGTSSSFLYTQPIPTLWAARTPARIMVTLAARRPRHSRAEQWVTVLLAPGSRGRAAVGSGRV